METAEIKNLWMDEFFARAAAEYWALTFDDLLLVPQMSEVTPDKVDITSGFTRNIELKIPISSSAMDTVTESRLAIAIAQEGGIGIIHKNLEPKEQGKEVSKVKFTLSGKIENPITINQKKKIGDISQLLRDKGYDFTTLVVTDDDGRLKGIITKDVMERAEQSSIIEDVMERKVVTRGPDTGIEEAYKIMSDLHQRIGKLVLVNADGTVSGMYTWKDVKSIMRNLTPTYNRDSKGRLRVGAAIGVHDYERAEILLKRDVDVLVVDVSHGHSKNVIDTITELKRKFTAYTFDVVGGNVATREGAEDLIAAGADGIKVGIGPGSICTTRVVTGAGMPQMTAVYEAVQACGKAGIPVIADGGIRYSGDITKVLGIRASSVMLGNILASTEEAPGETYTLGGKRYRDYRGMGSVAAMQKRGGRERYGQGDVAPGKVVPQGIEGRVAIKGTVAEVLYQQCGGLRAGMGLVGAKTIPELWAKARFVRVTGAGKDESHPHDIMMTKEAPNYQRE
jgi:IMP dehydrogenase